MKIGILAIQGDFTEHMRIVEMCGVNSKLVKLPEDLEQISGLIIPGGESTVIGKSLEATGLGKKIIERARNSMPIYGTCAGAILLAKKIIEYPHQYSLKLLDIEVDRNAFGRQVDSFETDIMFQEKKTKVTFIRAPRFVKVGTDVEVLIEYENEPVLVRHENILAGTFHPELNESTDIHKYFLNMCGE